MGETVELLTCPFCGYVAMTSGNPNDKIDPAINIHCSDCDCEGGWFRGKDCEKFAIIHWNTRAPAQQPRDPKVVAAVQEAIMRHPFWKPGLGSSGFAFGLANTAIDAYTSALTLPERQP